ncbi:MULTISPECIES: AAA family ATPase [Prochlorococcus]|uniref:AAA family ATPase n=1 Tax=Prochlorococcus TaxID=1218 RepID=UPI000533A580|nr:MULTISPECIES: AAA family ATPase [Prochlorococcus]KGG12230.1 DNA helicase related to phage enzyme [Prochlorococcus sp. MIT 0601]
MKEISLTLDQKKAKEAFELWLDKTFTGDPFILSGFAGTGKTYLSVDFLDEVEQRKLCWTVVAPTHKAVGVVRRALLKSDLNPTFYPSTIHRLLRLRLKKKGDLEICESTSQTANSLEQLKLVLVDEASMISSTLLEIILESAHAFKTRLVFVGDPAQLPPVGEEYSPVFSLKNASFAELTTVVRHQGPVLQLATLLRDKNFSCPPPPCFSTLDKAEQFVSSMNKNLWLESAKSSLLTASKNNDPDAARILCYTNRYLERLIPHARRAVHGTLADKMSVLPGEVLISRRAVMSNASLEQSFSEEEPGMLFSSNTELLVKDVGSEIYDFMDSELADKCPIEIPRLDSYTAKISIGTKNFSVRLLPEVDSISRKLLDSSLDKISLKARKSTGKDSKILWKIFFYLRDSFAYLSPASVLTVHRSQGSTFEEVFIASDIFWPKDLSLRRQLAYVAVSRASKGVYLLGSQEEDNQANIWNENFQSISNN